MIAGAAQLAEPLAKAGEAGKAGPVGLGVILLLCIACYFLFKSMSKHMRNVRENFPADGVEPQTGRVEQRASAPTTTPPPAGSSPTPPVQDPPTGG